jgi:hypothetical protein
MLGDAKSEIAVWEDRLKAALPKMEAAFNGVSIEIDYKILSETARRIVEHIHFYDNPNLAKQAGIVVFWIQKLKPYFLQPGFKTNTLNQCFTLLNEHIALWIALSLCKFNVKPANAQNKELEGTIAVEGLPMEFILRWVKSLRYRPHSRNSLIIAFELLMCDDKVN